MAKDLGHSIPDKPVLVEYSGHVLPPPDYSHCGFSPVHGDKIGVLECYLDESGTHSDRALIVGGFVAEVNKWAEFSREWKSILDEYGLKYFHMKEFMNGRSTAFKHLSARDKRDLIGLLIAAIKRTGLFSICCLAKPYQYRNLTTPEFRRIFGSCYSYSVRMCLNGIEMLLTDPKQGTETLGVFIEEGHPNCCEAIEHIREWKVEVEAIPRSFAADTGLLPPPDNCKPNDPYREHGMKIGAYGAGSKMSLLPLQAADLLVYCAHSGAVRSSSHAYTKSIWMNIAERVPPYVIPLSNLLPELVNGAEGFADSNKEKRRIVAQLIKDANRFGLRGEVIPHKGIDFSGSARDIKRFLKWLKITRPP